MEAGGGGPMYSQIADNDETRINYVVRIQRAPNKKSVRAILNVFLVSPGIDLQL
jgi:hypothetical protein